MRRLATPILLTLAVGFGAPLAADTGTAVASTGAVLEASTKARSVADPPPVAAVAVLEDGLSGSCTLRVADQGEARKGVKATFTAELIDGNTGNVFIDLGKKRGRTGRDGILTLDYPILRAANFAIQVALLVRVNLAGGKRLSEFEFSCSLIDETP